MLIAIEKAASIVIITDFKGNIEFVNKKFVEITGYQPDEVLGKNPRFLKSNMHDNKVYQELWDCISNGKEWTGKLINKKKNGKLFTVIISITPVLDGNGKINSFISIQQDITNYELLQDQIAKSQRMEAVGRLAQGIVHDFKNILSIISLNIDVIEDLEIGRAHV